MKKISLLLLVAMQVVWLPASVLHAQWNTNTSVNTEVSSLPTSDMVSVATSDAKTWVAFYHQNGTNFDMRAQLFDANGKKLLGDDGILVDSLPSGIGTYEYHVCVDADNNLVIGFHDKRTGIDQVVIYKISQSGTQLWGPEGIVLGEGHCAYPALLTTGEIVVSWFDLAATTLLIQKISASGTVAWSTPKSVMVDSRTTDRGQVIGTLGGKFSMVYQKNEYGIYTTLYAQMFDNDGTALYSPVQISDQSTSAARYYSIAVEGDTTYFGYYTAMGFRFNSFLQRINPDGTIPWGINGSIFNTATGATDFFQGETRINLAPGSPYVWSVCTFSDTIQTMYGIYIQKFLKTSGARQFTDSGKIVYPVSSDMNQQAGTLVLVEDTPMFMFYDVNYIIYVTRLDENGNFAWPVNQVEISSTSATMAMAKGRFGFTPDGPNRCVGIWTENRGGGDRGYAQGISVGGLIGIVVATQGGVPSEINTDGGTLQMVSTIYPSGSSQDVTWSIVPGTGQATISASGLVTAEDNGTVWAKAVAVQDPTMPDSIIVTITNQLSGIGGNDGYLPDNINLYPVPNNGLFTLESTRSGSEVILIRVFNPTGEKIYDSGEVNLVAYEKKNVDIRPVMDGVYFVRIQNGDSIVTRKIIVAQ